MTVDVDAILRASSPDDDPASARVAADYFLEQGDDQRAAAALDRAYGLCPDDAALAATRAEVLDRLVRVEHDLVFRFVPAGSFLMGSTEGDPDERPVHPSRSAPSGSARRRSAGPPTTT